MFIASVMLVMFAIASSNLATTASALSVSATASRRFLLGEDAKDDAKKDEGDGAMKTIPELAAADGRFSTLVAAVEAAGLGDALSGDDLTVFVPTNDAFEKLLKALGKTAEELLADTDTVTKVLKIHVVPSIVKSDAITEEGADLDTLGEDKLTAKLVDGKAMVMVSPDGEPATVQEADLMASNGVVHVIDMVLLPTDMAADIVEAGEGDPGEEEEGEEEDGEKKDADKDEDDDKDEDAKIELPESEDDDGGEKGGE